MAADLRPIYEAPTAEEAARQLDRFAAKWAGKYPSIAPAWRRAWAEVTAYAELRIIDNMRSVWLCGVGRTSAFFSTG